jgi:hypothetical protein
MEATNSCERSCHFQWTTQHYSQDLNARYRRSEVDLQSHSLPGNSSVSLDGDGFFQNKFDSSVFTITKVSCVVMIPGVQLLKKTEVA